MKKLAIFTALAALTLWGCDSEVTTNQGDNNAQPNNIDPNNTSAQNNPQCLQNSDCASGLCSPQGTCIGNGNTTNNAECTEGVFNAECGNCDPNCVKNGVGSPDNPFNLDNSGNDDESSQGVVLDPNGGITIDIQRVEAQFIWISNTGEGTVSKFDTRTFEEKGRYFTGPAGAGNDPSRTSVNTFGDVFVANRSGMTVSKISALGEGCPDTNGDGVVTTSSGSDILPWGQDDCVLWNVALNGGGVLRAVAAQDVRASDDTLQPAVWVGGWSGRVWKLSSDTGAVLVDTASPVSTYGFALDGRGNLWISGWTDNAIGRINTNLCLTTDSCADPVCDSNGDGSGDACVKERIAIGYSPYGITVDFNQRVWAGGQNILRYDPQAAAGSRIVSAPASFIHGIAADDKGFIWAAAMTTGVVRYSADDPTQSVAVPDTQFSSKGIAVDLDGKVWSINLSNSSATVVVPGPTLNDHTATTPITNLVSPYTYSDMTGSQLRFATNERGFYRRIFEGCDNSNSAGIETDWQELRWTAQTPGASSITFRARGANSTTALTTAEWIDLATVPPTTSPFDLAAALAAANLDGVRYVELEASLTAVRDASNNVSAPVLQTMEVTYSCPVILN